MPQAPELRVTPGLKDVRPGRWLVLAICQLRKGWTPVGPLRLTLEVLAVCLGNYIGTVLQPPPRNSDQKLQGTATGPGP